MGNCLIFWLNVTVAVMTKSRNRAAGLIHCRNVYLALERSVYDKTPVSWSRSINWTICFLWWVWFISYTAAKMKIHVIIAQVIVLDKGRVDKRRSPSHLLTGWWHVIKRTQSMLITYTSTTLWLCNIVRRIKHSVVFLSKFNEFHFM